MAEKERIGRAQAKTLVVGGVVVPKVAGGQATVTGTAVATPAGFKAITSVVATIGQADAAAGETVTAAWSGTTITFSVWKSDFTASTTPTVVNWVAIGS